MRALAQEFEDKAIKPSVQDTIVSHFVNKECHGSLTTVHDRLNDRVTDLVHFRVRQQVRMNIAGEIGLKERVWAVYL